MLNQEASRKVVRGACPHDCPDTCAWEVTVENGTAIKLMGDKNHPFTRGGLCAKVNHYLEDRVYSPDRLLYPLLSVGKKGEGHFEPVSWDEALDDVATQLKRIIAEDGPSAILPYSYMGTQGMIQGASLDRRFFARVGATRLERAVCGSAGGSGIAATLGTNTGRPAPYFGEIYLRLGELYEQEGDLRSAREFYESILELFPNRPDLIEKAQAHLERLEGT